MVFRPSRGWLAGGAWQKLAGYLPGLSFPPMNIRRCHRIASRIDALLRLELGHGIDGKRMLTETLYARDVLLVCDAHPDSDLAAMAHHFRAAVADTSDESGQASGHSTQSGLSSSFSSDIEASRPGTLPGVLPSAPGAQTARAGNWFSASRWRSK
jgi:hypothetical protein